MPKLLLKRKDVSGSVPDIADLVVGEVAINTADLKLFSLSADNTSVIQLAGYGFDHNKLGNLDIGDPHTQYITLSPRATIGSIYRNTISSLVDTPELVLKRFPGQTQPLTAWQDEDGTVLAAVQANGTFIGSGTNLYNLKASNLSIGTVAPANLGSGPPSDTTFLRGDSTWSTIPPSGAPTNSKYIVQGTTDPTLTRAQFLGSLTTGIVKNSTNTGVLSIAVAGIDYLAPTGDGSGLTNLNASNISSGTVHPAQLGSGTASTTTFLRGDSAWATLPPPAAAGGNNCIQYNAGGFLGADSELTWNATSNSLNIANGTININQGTITSYQNLITAASIWNNATVSFAGLWVSVTDQASSVSSYLEQFLVGGINKWVVDKTGHVIVGAAATTFIDSGVFVPARLGTGTPGANTWLRGDSTWQSEFTIFNISANTTLSSTANNMIVIDATSSAITITLPAASAVVGVEWILIRSDNSVKTVTIQRAGTDTFMDGTTSKTLIKGKFIRLISGGSSWFVVGSN